MKPLSPGDRTHERQNAFLRAVDTNPLIEIVRGHFRSDVRLRALVASFEIPLRAKTISSCQMSNPVTGPNGKQIHKPREW